MTTPNLQDWVRFHGTFHADPNKKPVKIEFQVETKDAVSSTDGVDRKPIYFTDIQFQSGNVLTGWTPNTKEMLDRLTWTHDETSAVATPNDGSATPQVFENIEKRWFNILGRGHGTLVVPNYYPEDWNVSILPSGIDLTLFPKENFDLLRISTNSGATLPEEKQFYKQEGSLYQEIKAKYDEMKDFVSTSTDATIKELERQAKVAAISNWENIIQPLLENHPLHFRYTREFWVDGAAAETEIKVHANTRTATVNGTEVKIVGEHELDVKGTKMKIDRKKFMLAPKGTATIRLEFYQEKSISFITYDKNESGVYFKVKKTLKYLEDVGIGYWGTASFYQWTYGRSRV